MSTWWNEKVAVVTGGSAGVGRAVARELARVGAKVAVLAREPARLEATRAELGPHALAIACDVADADAVESAADTIERELGPIDVWINNAMTSVFGEFVDVTPREYRRVTDVVYHGTVHGTMSALRRMLPRNRGRIVMVGSALAYRSIPLQSAYCGAKHAILGMFESLRSELLAQGSGVRLSIVQLPAVNTPQFDWCRSKLPRRARPVGTIYQPEIPARAIVACARSGQREMWVGLSTITAIVGERIAPTVGDHLLAHTAIDGQQTDEPEGPRPDNLFEPVVGDWAAHGRFDRRATRRSPLAWLAAHPIWRAAVVGAGLVGLAMVARASTRRPRSRRMSIPIGARS